MDEQTRLDRNKKIKENGALTHEKRKSQDCLVRTLKININHMNKKELEQLKMLFIESKWVRNSILSSDDIFNYSVKGLKSVNGFDKDRNIVEKPIKYLSSHMLQAIHEQVKQDITSLSAKKKRGTKVGSIKFCKNVNSINLKQYGNTYNIKSNGIKIQGFKRLLKVFGLKQLLHDYEFANAKLIKRSSGYYLNVTCFCDKTDKPKTNKSVGLDFGIKTTITTSDGEKFDICIKETESLKKTQRSLSKKQKGSNNRYKMINKVQRQYEKITNKKMDKANKIVNYLTTNYDIIYIQDENIKGWHSGKYGKQVQQSALGTIKSKLILKGSIVIDQYTKTTKECFCGNEVELETNERVFYCPVCGYTEDRDIKAAKKILFLGSNGLCLKK